MKYSVNVYLRKTKEKANVRMRVNYGGGSVEISLGTPQFSPSRWDSKRQRVRMGRADDVPAELVNAAIDDAARRVDELFLTAYREGRIPSHHDVREAVTGISKEDVPVIPTMRRWAMVSEKEKGWSKNTCYNMFCFINVMEEKGIFDGMVLEDIDKDVANKLSMRLMNEGYNNSTNKKYVRLLVEFLRWAKENGYRINDSALSPTVKLKIIKKDVIFLDADELKRMRDVPLRRYSTENIIRDMFMFSAYSSLRYSDIVSLRWDNIRDDAIHTNIQKTRKSVVIELNSVTRSIIDNYRDSHDPRIRDGDIFPRFKNFFCNKYVKKVAMMAGIDTPIEVVKMVGSERVNEVRPKYELLSMHCARRSFVVMALESGVPPNVVMKWTGHKDYNSMLPYIDISSKAKRSYMDMMISDEEKI